MRLLSVLCSHASTSIHPSSQRTWPVGNVTFPCHASHAPREKNGDGDKVQKTLLAKCYGRSFAVPLQMSYNDKDVNVVDAFGVKGIWRKKHFLLNLGELRAS